MDNGSRGIGGRAEAAALPADATPSPAPCAAVLLAHAPASCRRASGLPSSSSPASSATSRAAQAASVSPADDGMYGVRRGCPVVQTSRTCVRTETGLWCTLQIGNLPCKWGQAMTPSISPSHRHRTLTQFQAAAREAPATLIRLLGAAHQQDLSNGGGHTWWVVGYHEARGRLQDSHSRASARYAACC